MPSTLLSVQFKNLLPSEELLLFARVLWESAQRELRSLKVTDVTLSITKTDSKAAPFEASLQLVRGALPSVATSSDPLAAIEAAFSQLRIAPGPETLLASVAGDA